MIHKIKSLALFFLTAAVAAAQTPTPKAAATPASELTVDDSFDPAIADPAFPPGKGPAVFFDERHRNVVTLSTYFRPVGRFLGKDGYVVQTSNAVLAEANLKPARV